MLHADVFSEVLIAAARDAARASRVDGSATVEIVLTEFGIVIRGDRRDAPTAPRMAKSCEVRWRDALLNPALVKSSLNLVTMGLGLNVVGKS